MDNLRWILLAAGIFFILAIYFVGHQRRRNNRSDLFDNKDDLPDFSAQDWDEPDEATSKVHIVARESDENKDGDEDDYNESSTQQPPHHDEVEKTTGAHHAEQELNQEAEVLTSDDLFVKEDEVDKSLDTQPATESHETSSLQNKNSNADIIVLYILAKPSELLAGEKINSTAQANGFEFGSMNIYHYLDDNGQTIFSLANMIEPGNFDPDSIHDMTTTGLTMFMQLSNLTNPAGDFDDMLRSAYHISEMLGANLCNQNRQPITQADAEYYRNLISDRDNA